LRRFGSIPVACRASTDDARRRHGEAEYCISVARNLPGTRLDRRQRFRDCQPSGTDRPPVDFAAVRAGVTMTAVLGLLGFQPRTTYAAQQRGPCPLHGSTAAASRSAASGQQESG
jgi:hypothetical protein